MYWESTERSKGVETRPCNDDMESFFAVLKCEAFYSQQITKVSNTTVREIVLEYIHYYNCVRIQEKVKTTRENGWFALRLKAFVTDQPLKGH